jgi:hypothetical protein
LLIQHQVRDKGSYPCRTATTTHEWAQRTEQIKLMQFWADKMPGSYVVAMKAARQAACLTKTGPPSNARSAMGRSGWMVRS